MGTLIKTLANGSIVEFDKGKFDAWCVYVTPPVGFRFAPTDLEYFSRLQILGTSHGHRKIYEDFVSFYVLTDASLNCWITDSISTLSHHYHADAHEMEQWFTVIYAGMVAEENKQGAILKKRVKRLGMHQILIEGKSPSFAAHFSRGKKWRELDGLMRDRGF